MINISLLSVLLRNKALLKGLLLGMIGGGLMAYGFIEEGSEKELFLSLKQPEILLSHSEIHPVASVMEGDRIYYADSGNDRQCMGRNLYSYSLTEKKEEKLATMPCVIQIQKSYAGVLVTYRNKKEEWRLDRVHESKLVPFSEQSVALAIARLYFKWDEMEREKHRPIYPLFCVSESKLTAMVCGAGKSGEKPLVLVDTFLLPQQTPLFGAPADYSNAVSLSVQDCELARNGIIYLAGFQEGKDGQGERAKIFAFNPETAEQVAQFGSVAPLPRSWSQARSEEWGARRVGFLELTKAGFIVAGYTSLLSELWALSYYSNSDKLFYRLPIRLNDLGGMSYVGEEPGRVGLLISKPQARQIVFYGVGEDK